MALSQQVKVVSSKFFNDIATAFTVTAGAFNPTDGHFLITPNGDAMPAAINLRTVVLGVQATALTTCTMKVCLDAAGVATIGYATGVVVLNSGGDYNIIFNVDILVANANIDPAVLSLLSTDSGRIYLLFEADATLSVSNTIVEWEACQV
jgi:hypothetical protein